MGNMTFLEAIQISILAMLIVFVLLSIISQILASFEWIFKEKKTVVEKPIVPTVPVTPTVQGISYKELEEDLELQLASMIATIDMAGDKDISNYRVVSAKKI